MIIDDPFHMFKPADYAQACLYAAMDEDNETAVMGLMALIENHGMPALYVATLVWCDAYHEHATDGTMDVAAIASVSVMDETTGRMQPGDDDTLEPWFKWSAGMLLARTNHDPVTFNALWDSLADVDGKQRGQYVMTLLVTIARTMRGMPRGFAVMGMDVDHG